MDHTNDSTNVSETGSGDADGTKTERNGAPNGTPGPKSGTQRKRGSRGGQNRRPAATGASGAADKNDIEIPERISEGRPSAEASERGLVRSPKIGDTMPVPSSPPPGPARSS